MPLDDDHTMYWGWQVTGATSAAAASRHGARTPAPAVPLDAAAPVTAPASSTCRTRRTGSAATASTRTWRNDYLHRPRGAGARAKSYTGIRGVRQQDKAVTESMGPIMDRTNEHLGTSDAMIIRTRRKRLMRAAKALAEDGTVPPGVDNPEVYRSRSGSIILPRDADWLDATKHLRHPDVAIGEPAVQR